MHSKWPSPPKLRMLDEAITAIRARMSALNVNSSTAPSHPVSSTPQSEAATFDDDALKSLFATLETMHREKLPDPANSPVTPPCATVRG